MNKIQAVFLDDGGVLNNNELRAPQWQELIAQYFAPRYGGDHNAWMQANRIAFENLMKSWEKAKLEPKIDFNAFWQTESELWITTMFHHVGVSPPPPHEQYNVAIKAEEWITPRIQAAFPGAIQTVRYLKERGYLLYTASGGTSWQLRGYLTGMGITDYFEEFYGADIINTMKASALFYKRIFRHAGISPEQALVVDDFPENVLRAKEVGATGVLVTTSENENQENLFHSIKRIDSLPNLLDKIFHKANK
ncbi:MAG: HAD family hydrolase [Candidatus Hermodarchaeia archaeon]|jgi:HAD superfamily hydrolase (TIGR01509 family)